LGTLKKRAAGGYQLEIHYCRCPNKTETTVSDIIDGTEY
jgi:hypothetical protein